VLLRLRLSTIEQISIEQTRADTLAGTDPLTGTLSRTGLLALAPTVAAAAKRSGDPVSIITCDVEHMTQSNGDYALAYGDAVLSATARALAASFPHDALISRWDGDQFLALFLGSLPDVTDPCHTCETALATTGVALGKHPVSLQLQGSSGDPGKATLEDLVAQTH
jgi:diguanylate cyclase (GGDEF)-like protein